MFVSENASSTGSGHTFDNSIGIWLSKPVNAFGLRTNSFHHVTTPVSAGH